MAAEESYGRSSSRNVPIVEQRYFLNTSKPQQKTASDKLAWFSPMCSPLLSPGREKTVRITKKKARQSSMFSMSSSSKGPIDTEEPTSPKVSCIGQVRGTHKKTKDPIADTSKKKPPQWRPGSASPARFFTSPGSKWGSLFGSRKEGRATPSSSCFNGDHELEKQSTLAGSAYGHLDPYAHVEAAGSHTFAATYGCDCMVPSKGPHVSVSSLDADKHFGYEKSMEEQHFHVKPRQRLPYAELPSLHSGASGKQNMKISVEVVRETWLCGNGENLRPDGMLRTQHAYERVGRGEFGKVQVDMVTSPCNGGQLSIVEAKESHDHVCTSDLSQLVHSQGNHKETWHLPESVTACAPTRKGDEEKIPPHQIFKDTSTTLYKRTCEKEGKRDCTSLDMAERVEANTSLQVPKKSSDESQKQSHGLRFPQAVEKKLHSACSGKEGDSGWTISKNKKSPALSAQPFSTLILVGCDANQHQPTIFKYGGHKVSTEELLKGVFEVGRLSFHGSGKYFHLLKGGAEFIRSRSVTSHQTVVQLQRCNSDPCRPSL